MLCPVKEALAKGATEAARGEEESSDAGLNGDNTSSCYGEWISVQRNRHRPAKTTRGTTGNSTKESVSEMQDKD